MCETEDAVGGVRVIAEGYAAPGAFVCIEVPGRWEAVAGGLLPAEVTYSERFGSRRRIAWAAGRLALRRALSAVGSAVDIAILATTRGAPALPDGVRGSISHKGLVAVGYATTDTSVWLGVDVERCLPQRKGLAARALTHEERDLINELPANCRWPDTLERFSVKEAIFKAVDPLLRRPVPFTEVALVRLGRGWSVHHGFRVGHSRIQLRVTTVPVPDHFVALTSAGIG